MGFVTDDGGQHAVMVRQVKIWSSGHYKVYFSETSPSRIAPRYTKKINVRKQRFYTFYKKD